MWIHFGPVSSGSSVDAPSIACVVVVVGEAGVDGVEECTSEPAVISVGTLSPVLTNCFCQE